MQRALGRGQSAQASKEHSRKGRLLHFGRQPTGTSHLDTPTDSSVNVESPGFDRQQSTPSHGMPVVLEGMVDVDFSISFDAAPTSPPRSEGKIVPELARRFSDPMLLRASPPVSPTVLTWDEEEQEYPLEESHRSSAAYIEIEAESSPSKHGRSKKSKHRPAPQMGDAFFLVPAKK